MRRCSKCGGFDGDHIFWCDRFRRPLPLPEAKVTVIIEKGDNITTISVPLSSDVVVQEHMTGDGLHVSFNMEALFDIDRNSYYTASTKPRDPDNLGDHIVLGEN